MQSDHKEIYKKTAERNNIDEQIYKDIGNTVFASLYSHFRKPPTLILRLKGVGSWHLRKKRMDIVVNEFPPDFEKKPEDFTSTYGIIKYEDKVALYNLFKDRLADYDKYLALRDEIRKKRYETQYLLEPPSEEE